MNATGRGRPIEQRTLPTPAPRASVYYTAIVCEVKTTRGDGRDQAAVWSSGILRRTKRLRRMVGAWQLQEWCGSGLGIVQGWYPRAFQPCGRSLAFYFLAGENIAMTAPSVGMRGTMGY